MGSQDSQPSQHPARMFVAGVFACSAGWLGWLAGADVASGDSGELGSASYLLGVAHPTGFPLDLLALRLAALVPLGPIAWRQSVCVALGSAAVLALLARVILQVAQRVGVAPERGGYAGALVGVAALLGFKTFVGTALGVEVYSTALALNLVAALCLLRAPGLGRAVWPLFGVALGAHVTAGFLMLPALVLSVLVQPSAARLRLVRARAPLLLLCGVLIIAYLPLAARRDSAADWGDPETLGRLFAHLTAARIRSSFAHEMFEAAGTPSLMLLRQLGEHGYWLVFSLLGAVCLLRRQRALGLSVLSVLTLDLAYAVWINPMGIADRQLGHASGAVLALLAGVGVAAVCGAAARSARARLAGVLAACVCSAWLLREMPWPDPRDGYVVGERFGAASSLSALPPRSVLLCSSDSACAGALFALYVEAARPDVAAAPAQHLWDATVLRRLRELPAVAALSPSQPLAPEQRRGRVAQVLAALLKSRALRPLELETEEALRRAHLDAKLAAYDAPPFLTLAGKRGPVAADGVGAVAAVDALVHARFGAAGPRSELARGVWSAAYDELGKAALHAGDAAGAVLAESRAVRVLPTRAVALSNLGVALEARGELAQALEVTRRAVLAAPERPRGWLNLARLEGRLHGAAAARQVVHAAGLAGVQDDALSALRRALDAPSAPPAPSTSRAAGADAHGNTR